MFTWIPIYKEFAEKLLQFRNNRKPLVDWIYQNLSDIKRIDGKSLIDYLHQADKSHVKDIDPFSVFGIFNRGTSDANRNEFLSRFKTFLSIESAIPSDYSGIPILNPMKSFFFSWGDDNASQIDTLWSLYEKALSDKDFGDEYNKAISYNGIGYSITMALFWIKPEKYLPLDKNTRTYLSSYNIDITGIPSYDEYVNIMKRVGNFQNDGVIQEQTFFEFSNNAWQYSPDGKYKVWLYDATYGDWKMCQEEGIWGLNNDDVDYTQFETYEEYKQWYYENAGGKTNDKMLKSNYAISGFMSVGDIIIVRHGLSTLYGYGVVKSDCIYDGTRSNLKTYREVDWHLSNIKINKIKIQGIWFNEIKRKVYSPLFKTLGIVMDTPETLCDKLIEYYKELHKKAKFNGYDEEYKWRLVQECMDAEPLTIVSKFFKSTYSNLMFAYQVSSLGMIYKSNPQELSQAITDLFDDSKPLKERLDKYAADMNVLTPKGKAFPGDERTAAALLTCHDPNQYAFYMSDTTYRPFCEYMGVENANVKNENYPHFLSLLGTLTKQVGKDKELKDMMKLATPGFEQYDLMTAQTILWCMQGHWEILMGETSDDINIKAIIKKFYSDNNLMDVYQKRIALDGKDPNIWLWAPGEKASEWNSLRQSEEIALGWDYIGDYTQYASDEDFIAAFRANEEYKTTNPDQALFMVKAFRDDIKTGDLVLVKNGLTEIIGWGYVTSDYYFSPTATLLKSRHKAKWIGTDHFTVGKHKSTGKNRQLPQKSLTEISKYPHMVSEIFELISQYNNMEYGFVSEEVKVAASLLDNSGQIILQGAPGCGKTYMTTELAVYLCDGKVPKTQEDKKKRYKELQEEGRIGFTTFHQSLDYEEFVEGLKPVDPKETSGDMKFAVKPGIFRQICEKAKALGGDKCVLIIDEINRANISKVLGELITLLEKTKRIGNDDEFTVKLPYSGDIFGVPANLYIIGTMNTADRSLGYIDYAIRRRFAFQTLKSDSTLLSSYYKNNFSLLDKATNLYNEVKNIIKDNLSSDFEFDDFMVGHSYFMAKNDNDFRLNLTYKIIPLLQEYLRDGILTETDGLKEHINSLDK